MSNEENSNFGLKWILNSDREIMDRIAKIIIEMEQSDYENNSFNNDVFQKLKKLPKYLIDYCSFETKKSNHMIGQLLSDGYLIPFVRKNESYKYCEISPVISILEDYSQKQPMIISDEGFGTIMIQHLVRHQSETKEVYGIDDLYFRIDQPSFPWEKFIDVVDKNNVTVRILDREKLIPENFHVKKAIVIAFSNYLAKKQNLLSRDDFLPTNRNRSQGLDKFLLSESTVFYKFIESIPNTKGKYKLLEISEIYLKLPLP